MNSKDRILAMVTDGTISIDEGMRLIKEVVEREATELLMR